MKQQVITCLSCTVSPPRFLRMTPSCGSKRKFLWKVCTTRWSQRKQVSQTWVDRSTPETMFFLLPHIRHRVLNINSLQSHNDPRKQGQQSQTAGQKEQRGFVGAQSDSSLCCSCLNPVHGSEPRQVWLINCREQQLVLVSSLTDVAIKTDICCNWKWYLEWVN